MFEILRDINNLAYQKFKAKDFEGAKKLMESINPLPDELRTNLAKCYYYTGDAHKALETLNKMKEFKVDHMIDRALYLNAIGNNEAAKKIYLKINERDPSNSKVRFNLGWNLLVDGDFKKGFEYLESGRELNCWGNETRYIESGLIDSQDKWDYVSKVGTLALILEGGLGDEIIFLRWADMLKSHCNRLIIICHDSLLRLLVNAGYDCYPTSMISNLKYDEYVMSMSIPGMVESVTDQLPKSDPFYIRSFTDKLITKRIRSISDEVIIGVKWMGNPEFEHDQFRTIPKIPLLNIINNFGTPLSLQIDDDDPTIHNANGLISDWQDTYSVINSVDLIITSCTSTAHLAGAMGANVIVFVPIMPYFVWANEDTPWYGDNVTIIRQTEYGDWSEAFKTLEQILLYRYGETNANI